MGADRERALAMYRRSAAGYDRRLRLATGLHRRAVEQLAPQPGETIVDVGCGTGLSFAALEAGMGASGRLIGVELSPDMLVEADARTKASGWDNVTLIQSPAEEAVIPEPVDAVLFVLTHDVLQSPEALRNVVASIRPGGRVVAASSKWAPRWAVPLNAYVGLKARRYVTTFESFDRPWQRLAALVPELEVRPVLGGMAYVAAGTIGYPEGGTPTAECAQ